jgi:two-component system, OmpR family, copper resistance phosphate regulon response regulator CusR
VARILIAEDDPRIGRLLEKALQKHGYSTFLADDGNKAHSLSLTDEFDLMILDMGLPQREGFQVLQDLRAHGKTLPVLVLTGRSERDVVMCLEAGADDYMRKPFQFDDLLERVRARLEDTGTAEPNILKGGKVRLDLRARRTTVDGESVDLSAREFALLETLLRNAGQVLSREQLQSKVWGYSFDASSNVVDLHVNSLSDKIGGDVIETVRGAGYRLQVRS